MFNARLSYESCPLYHGLIRKMYLSYKLQLFIRMSTTEKISITTRVKITIILYVCLISAITRRHVTRFISRHFFEMIDEWQRVRCFQCLVSRYSLSIWMETKVLKNDQNPTTKRFVLIIETMFWWFLEAEENKTTQRKTQTDVAFVMTFQVNCGEQKQKQQTLAVSCF